MRPSFTGGETEARGHRVRPGSLTHSPFSELLISSRVACDTESAVCLGTPGQQEGPEGKAMKKLLEGREARRAGWRAGTGSAHSWLSAPSPTPALASGQRFEPQRAGRGPLQANPPPHPTPPPLSLGLPCASVVSAKGLVCGGRGKVHKQYFIRETTGAPQMWNPED